MASDADSNAPVSRSGRALWLWVGAAFLFLALLWTAMVFAARAADSRTVPLSAKEAKK